MNRAPLAKAPEGDSEIDKRWSEISRANVKSPVRGRLELELARSTLPVEQLGWEAMTGEGDSGGDRPRDWLAGREEMLARLGKEHPQRALSQVNGLARGKKSQLIDQQSLSGLRRRVFREWLRTDPKSALAEAGSNAFSGITRGQNLQALMEEWSRLDPAAASVALATLPESGPGYARKDFAATLVRQWHGKDPAAARQWAQTQADPALRESMQTLIDELDATDPAAKAAVLLAAPDHGGGKLAGALGEWLSGDPAAALTKLSAIPAGDRFWANEAADAALWWAMDSRGTLTPEQYLEILSTIPAGPPREAFLKGLASYGASNDIPFAVRILSEMAEGRPREEAVGMLTELWMRKDPVKTSEWLAALPADATSRHHGVARFAENLAPDDPARAAAWAATLPDGFWQKESVVKAVLEQWRAKDPAAAAAWAGEVTHK